MPTPAERVLATLLATPGLTQTGLAVRVGVSTRHLRRRLQALCAAGMVEAEPDGPALRYRATALAEAAADVPRLTEAEAEALAVAALAARPLLAPTPLADPLDSAATKLRAESVAAVVSFEPEDEPARWSFDGAAGGVTRGLAPEHFRALLGAARGGHAVEADYFTARTRTLRRGRRLGPLALVVRSGTWMAACRDLDAADAPVKDFALAGFRAVTPRPEALVDPPAGWSARGYGADRLGALDGPAARVRLWVSPEAAPYFRRKAYIRSQAVEAEHADGAMTVSFETAGLEDARAFVMGWGALVRVEAPPALAAAVAEAHRRAAAQYNDATVDSESVSR